MINDFLNDMKQQSVLRMKDMCASKKESQNQINSWW